MKFSPVRLTILNYRSIEDQMSTLSNRKQRSIPQNTASTVVENQPVDVVQPLPYLNLRPTSLLLSRLSLITFFILATVTFITNVQRLLDNPYQVYVFKLLRMNESDTDPKAKLLRYIYASAELASLFVTAPWFIYLYMLQNHRPKVAALIKLQEAPIESVQVGVNTKKTDIPLTMVVSTPASVQPSTTLPSATMIRFLNKRIQIARTGALWGSVCLVGLQVTMMHWLWMQTYGKYFVSLVTWASYCHNIQSNSISLQTCSFLLLSFIPTSPSHTVDRL